MRGFWIALFILLTALCVEALDLRTVQITGESQRFSGFGYTHLSDPIDTASIQEFVDISASLKHPYAGDTIIYGVIVTYDGYKVEVIATPTGPKLDYTIYEGDTVVSKGSLYLGEKVDKTYKRLKYYIHFTKTGAYGYPEFDFSVNVTRVGNIKVYSTTYELSDLYTGSKLRIKLVDKEPSTPYYLLNGKEYDDPNTVVTYRSSPTQTGKIVVKLMHDRGGWEIVGSTAVFKHTYASSCSVLDMQVTEPTGDLFVKEYSSGGGLPDITVDNQLLIILGIVILAVVLLRR